jgi:hypothetical protein
LSITARSVPDAERELEARFEPERTSFARHRRAHAARAGDSSYPAFRRPRACAVAQGQRRRQYRPGLLVDDAALIEALRSRHLHAAV